MKKNIIMVLLSLVLAWQAGESKAQATEVAQLLLNVEKLSQFKQILSDMKAGYQILSGGYNTIKSLSEGNFKLHKVFLDGLMEVNPEIRNYRKVADIISLQIRIVDDYKSTFNRLKSGGIFREEELNYISGVYDRLIRSSLRNLDELTLVLTSGKLRMSDQERLESIDRIYEEMLDKFNFLRSFNGNADQMHLQRSNERHQNEILKQIQGIEP